MPTVSARSPQSKRKRCVVAMVLGTALSTLGAASGLAASETELRTVNDISRYCTACWRNARLDPDSWTDCTQEVFCRLLERVDPDAWDLLLKAEGEERREFLRAIDTVKKRSQRARKWTASQIDSLPDRYDLHEQQLGEQREAVRQAAAELLTPRQQRVLQMSFEGWSVHDIAAKLDLPPERVSDEKYKAVRKLRQRLCPDLFLERA
jgi:RNA polymerase sigma factor (sigma-70 family)